MTVRVEDREPGLRVILLDRPDKRNALDLPTVAALGDAIRSAGGATIVLGSTAPDAFSAGADLHLADADRAAVSEALYALYFEMRSAPQVIIAAASGHAVGGGAQLLIASDLRVAAPDLRIRFVGPGHGLAVGAWGLPSLVGRGRATDLCLSMRSVAADEALTIGLIDRLADDPLGAAIDYARDLCRLDPGALRAVKMIVGMADAVEALRSEQTYNSGWDGSIPAPRDD
ncbi:MAG: enoyl-CoA hydratase/isomerase family protein [Acidimicrobiia bacterium]|nr:enoyl-CoA hydratase/isomerase family protein [Acidimicrobiia bacterium]